MNNVGIGEIIIAKHRNGALDSVRLRFIKEYARFDNLEGFKEDPNVPAHTTLAANNEFDNQGSYTMQSKMNTLENENHDFDTNNEGDTPF